MKQKKINWHKLADSVAEIPFSSNSMASLSVAGKNICVALHKDQLMACAQKCPHGGGMMAEGHLDALGNIVCPLHRYKFNLQNGRNVSGEGYFLKTFQVEIRKEGVFVGFEENKLFNW